MSNSNFSRCLALVLKHEGGYVNHPKDPGAATNKGVIQATYNAYRDKQKLPRQSVRHITDAEVARIYKRMYWDVVKGDDLPVGLDYVTFDASVNSGTGRGPKWTQRALGVTADGKVGPQTLDAADSVSDMVPVIKKACSYRLGFMKGLRHWDTFGRGWSRRVAEVEAAAIGMVAGSAALLDEATKARDSSRKEAVGTIGSVGGGAAVVTATDLPSYATYAVYGVLAIAGLVVVKRVLSGLERAKVLRKVAEDLEKAGGRDED